MKTKQIPASFILFFQRCYKRMLMVLLRPLFASYGRNVIFDPTNSLFTYKNITLGDHVYIGPGAYISSIKKIHIGNKVLIAPGVSMIGGDHNVTQMGRFMYDVHEKLPGNDLEIVVEDDVWIGANATILKGVTIGRGAVVAAGSLVNKDVPPYAIAGGVPAKVLRWRWTTEEVVRHEEALYPAENRLSIETLETIRKSRKSE